MTVLEIVQLLGIVVRLATDVGIDIAEFKASLDENGNLPDAKRDEFVQRARIAVAKL